MRPETKAQIVVTGIVATLVLGLVGVGKVQRARSPEAIYDAIDRGDRAEIRRLLDLGANPNGELSGGMTPLDLAIVRGKEEVARTLLERGAFPKAEPGRTGPLHRAVMLNRVSIVNALLRLGADPNGTDEQGMTPLLIAADRGATEVVEPLIAAGASLTATANQNGTALHLAAARNNPKIVVLLANHRAKVDVADLNGLTPLMVACITGSTEAGRALLARGANPNLTVTKSVADSVTARLFLGTTPVLQNATSTGELLIPLLEAGADGSVRDQDGNTILHLACLRLHSKESIARLIALGLDPGARNGAGETPLHAAAKAGNRFAIPALLAAGAEADARDGEGQTPLHRLASLLLPVTASLLLDAGADPDAKDDQGRTPLDIAKAQNEGSVPALPSGAPGVAGGGFPVASGHPNGGQPMQFRDPFDKRRTAFVALLESAPARGKRRSR